MREVDTQRQLQNEADEERAKVAFSGAGAGRQEGERGGIGWEDAQILWVFTDA